MSEHREIPPNRRPHETVAVRFRGQKVYVSIGIHPETGKMIDVFGSTAKASTDMSHLLTDACILVSLAMQHGVELSTLAKSLGKEPSWSPDDPNSLGPSSLIGAVVATLIAWRDENEPVHRDRSE